MSDKTKLHGLPIAVKKYAICAGCQTCLRLDENEKIVDGGPHYIAVEDITNEYISLVKNEPNNSMNLTDEQIRQKLIEILSSYSTCIYEKWNNEELKGISENQIDLVADEIIRDVFKAAILPEGSEG